MRQIALRLRPRAFGVYARSTIRTTLPSQARTSSLPPPIRASSEWSEILPSTRRSRPCRNTRMRLSRSSCPSVTADVITARGFRNVFRLPTKDSTEGQLFARTFLAGRKATTVIAVATEGDYGHSVAEGLVTQAKVDKHDAELLNVNATADPENTAAIIIKRDASLVFLAGKPERFGPLAKALRSQNYKGDLAASDAFFTMSVLDPYGKALSGATVATSTPPLERIPTMISLLRDFHAEVGDIDAFSAYGYAAAAIVDRGCRTVQRARSICTSLQQMQQGGAYNLLVGQYAFSFSGDASLPNIYFYTLSPTGFTFERAAVPNGFVV